MLNSAAAVELRSVWPPHRDEGDLFGAGLDGADVPGDEVFIHRLEGGLGQVELLGVVADLAALVVVLGGGGHGLVQPPGVELFDQGDVHPLDHGDALLRPQQLDDA